MNARNHAAQEHPVNGWLLATALALLVPGCVAFGAPEFQCLADADCGSGTCSSAGVCVPGGKRAVRLEWAMASESGSSETTCGGDVEEIEIWFHGRDGETVIHTVNCAAQQAVFGAIPMRFDQVSLIAVGHDGAEKGRAQAALPTGAEVSVSVDIWR